MTNVDGRTLAIAMTRTVDIDRTGIDQVKTITPASVTKQWDQLISGLEDIIENLAELKKSMDQTSENLVGLGEDIKQLSQTTARLCVKSLPLFT